MKKTITINSLQDLANWINSDDFNAIELGRIIAEHGWTEGDSDYDFGSDGIDRIIMQDDGKVALIPII